MNSKSILITPQQVRAEQYKRSFYRFAKDSFKVLHNGKEWDDNWHIQYLCEVLQKEILRVISGSKREKHLIINVPPRTLKSELTSIYLPAYCWALKGDVKIISTSYSASLSMAHNVQCRRLIESDWYRLHFPNVVLSEDENTKSKFTTKIGGIRFSTSTGGTMTGMGGDIIIIDDPQNPQMSMSEAERLTSNSFFNETLRSRLDEPEVGLFIVIMQRLHEQDLTGMLLSKEPDNWNHICLPAEENKDIKPIELKDNYKDGLLFGRRLSREGLTSLKTGMGSYGYSGQYLQSPSPSEGGIIKASWFGKDKYYPNKTLDFFLDTAYTDKQHNDATAILSGCQHEGKLCVKKVESVRLEFPELIKYIDGFVLANGGTSSSRVYVEPKASGKSIVQQLRKSTRLNIIELPSTAESKLSRVASVSALIEAGKVVLLEGSYIDGFLSECINFPNGKHDDMVDVLVFALQEYFQNKKNTSFIFHR